MRKTLLILLIFVVQSKAQIKKGQNEIALPLNPWIILTKSYFIDFEHFKSPKKSLTFRAGYQGDNFLISWFSKLRTTGIRADVGKRWYLKGETSKVFRFYSGINFTAERTSLKLNSWFNVPKDSLEAKGFSFAPELNAGLKIVIFKKLTLTPSLGLRYYFNTINTDNITYRPIYWTSNTWNDNMPIIWQQEREKIKLQNYRKGFVPIPYINIGWIF